MSYCRWNSEDFKCDVYVYADAGGGWTTHVASNRLVFKQSLPPEVEWNEENLSAWVERHNAVLKLVMDADRQPITLPHAGETFSDPTPEECANRLEKLRALGYVVPQYAIDELREDAEFSAKGPKP